MRANRNTLALAEEFREGAVHRPARPTCSSACDPAAALRGQAGIQQNKGSAIGSSTDRGSAAVRIWNTANGAPPDGADLRLQRLRFANSSPSTRTDLRSTFRREDHFQQLDLPGRLADQTYDFTGVHR